MRPTPLVLILSLGLAQACLAAVAPADSARPAPGPASPDSAAAAALQGAPAPASDPEAGAAVPEAEAAPGVPAIPAPRQDTLIRISEPVVVEAPGSTRLMLGGTFQLKAFAHNLTADSDADKSLSLELRRARLDLSGNLGESFSYEGNFRMEANGRNLGSEAIYLAWKLNDLIGLKGGKLKRPFSQEALQSSKSLYTVERGELYQTFLTTTTGYSLYDVGLVFYGGFVDEDVPVTYEAGIFNGKQSNNPDEGYTDQHYQARDGGLKAKDLAFRLQARPFAPLKVEAALSTKAAEDKTDPDNFDYHVNTAYEVGADFHLGRLRLLGEAAWGDNHQGRDARIISGSTLFFAFYGMAVWHEDYSRGRASELVLRLEGLDPDFETGSGEGSPNDGRLRYTLGCNYFFTPKVSVLVDYALLQPITKVPGEDDLVHDIDAMWRLNF